MFKINKKFVAIAAASGACIALLAAAPANAATDSPDAGTQFVTQLQSDAAVGDQTAVDSLASYDALTDAQKAQFDTALQQLADKGLADADSVDGVDVVSQAGSTAGAASTTNGLGAKALAAAVAPKSWSAYCSQSVKLLGITVAETRVDGDFDANSVPNITGIRNARARLVRNVEPLTNISIKEVRTQVSGGIGSIHALVRAERGPLKGGTSQSENYQTLSVNGKGKVTACKWGW